MKFKKITVMLGALCSQGLVGQAYADASSGHHCKPVQFYAGLAGGIERLSGKRNESANEDAGGGARITTIFTDGKSMNENNVAVSLLTGFLWKPSNHPIVLGPEIFFGRGNTTSTVNDDRFDAASNAFRHYSTTLQRKLFYGALVRAGYQFCGNYLVYLSLGFDRGQFARTTVLAADPANITTTSAKNTKWLNGLLFGLGFEKRIDSFVVGLDLRAVRYGKYNAQDSVLVAPGVGPGTLSCNAKPRIYFGTLRICYQF